MDEKGGKRGPWHVCVNAVNPRRLACFLLLPVERKKREGGRKEEAGLRLHAVLYLSSLLFPFRKKKEEKGRKRGKKPLGGLLTTLGLQLSHLSFLPKKRGKGGGESAV